MKRILSLIPALVLLPALALAQTEGPGKSGTIPNSHASDIAKTKVAAAMARRATHVVGEAVGLDNLPVAVGTPAPATSATPATPHPGEGPATPATPATPSANSHRPDHAGQGGQGRGNNPRRP
ncbi:MAG TPA: hypothetical protein VNJ06_04305 [Gemmatimonadales bacterium]|nr:hypothetical protein [Gemmatimonadales bacterium]